VAATAAIGVVLLAGVPTAFMLWRGRGTPAVAPAAIAVTGEATPGAPPPSTLPPSPSAAVPSAPAASSAPVTKGADVPAATVSGAAPAKVGPAAPAAGDVSTPAPGAASLPILTFAKVRLLVVDGNKSRDRETSLRLGADGLDVMDGAATVQRAAYSDVIGLFHSHSREPRWETPDGTAVPVAKTGGKFGFFKGTPDWITVRTRHTFIPLRVDDDDLTRVIAELESRTGTRVVRTR
jgi:hypothetical protein